MPLVILTPRVSVRRICTPSVMWLAASVRRICSLICFVRRDLRERQSQGRAAEPVEVLVQAEDAAVVEAQPFPDGVAALHDRIERADAGLVAMDEAAVDVDDEVAVFVVEFLEHRLSWMLTQRLECEAEYSVLCASVRGYLIQRCEYRRS